MAKEGASDSNQPRVLQVRLDTESLTLLREMRDALKKATGGAATPGGAAAGAPGSPTAQADRAHRETFWQRVTGIDDPTRARNAGIAGATGAAAAALSQIGGTALAAGLNPFLTRQERGIATERAAITAGGGAVGGGIGATIGSLILPGLGTIIGGQIGAGIGSAVSGALASAHRKEEEQVIGEARGGFADLRELAKAGYRISDEQLQQRAQYEREASQRGAEFDKRVSGALSGKEEGAVLVPTIAGMLDKVAAALDNHTAALNRGAAGAAGAAADTVNRRGA